MNVFEPLFLLLVLVTLGTLGTTVVFAAAGHGARAGRILRRWMSGAAVYFAVVIVVSIVTPRRTCAVAQPQCFDDWCITVTASHPAAGAPLDLDVGLRVSNRARRVTMGERGAGVRLVDAQGRVFVPEPQGSNIPLDTRIAAGTSFETTRRFHVPPDSTGLYVEYTHDIGFPIGWLIISEGGWFARAPRMNLE